MTASLPATMEGSGEPSPRVRWDCRGCLITFHRAAPPGAWEGLPNRGFHIDAAFLDRFLGWLKAHGWEIVSVSEVLRRLREGSASRFVNFSIDDAYRDTWELVVPLFHRHRAPVTVYVTTGIPDGADQMWGAGLETILRERDRVTLDSGNLDVGSAKLKRAAFGTLQRKWEPDDPVAHYERFCRQNGYAPDALRARHAISWDMLERMRDDPFVELGAHTVRHSRLSELSESMAWEEINGSGERLAKRLGVPVRHFAFPFGRRADCGPREFRMAREAGFESAATTRKALLIGERHNPHALPRVTLNGGCRSLALARAHLAGVSAMAAHLAGRT